MPAPQLQRPALARYHFDGYLAGYLEGLTRQWLLPAPEANPAMLEIFRDRDRLPLRDLVPWAGEFAGKHLVSCVQMLRLTGDPALRVCIVDFVAELIRLQANDGYLGPWPHAYRLTGQAPNVYKAHGTWDAWGHYHISLGMLLWYEETGDRQALDCAIRIADLLCDRFLATDERLVDTGSTEMNLAVIHSLCLLYRHTETPRYLALARQIVDEFAAEHADGPLAGDYLRTALAGVEFFATPKPRWESLHPIMGMAELYWLTGESDYRRAFEHIWWSIARLDRHNTGGFSSGEQAQGTPYHPGAIETCCTVAWMALGVEMLKLTGESIVADELELATLNATLGSLSRTGRWATYDTPMDGVRKASAHSIVFQSRAGSPELNCCSVNAPRGLGLLSDWALLTDHEGLLLNWYGPCELSTVVQGVPVQLRQVTDYPRTGRVILELASEQPIQCMLKLRIPSWSAQSVVQVNGEPVEGVEAGRYLGLDRLWQTGDTITIDLDLSPHYWRGEEQLDGLASIYRGPVLLAYDRRLNTLDPEQIPTLDGQTLMLTPAVWTGRHAPIVYLTARDASGHSVMLCDFGSAGEDGSPYRSCLPLDNIPQTPLSRANPLRSARPVHS
jgi:DUF1680 family protein